MLIKLENKKSIDICDDCFLMKQYLMF